MAKSKASVTRPGRTGPSSHPGQGERFAFGRHFLLPALVIAAVSYWIYEPSLRGTWVGDDAIYLTRNPLLFDPARLWKAWFEPGSFIEYYPVQQTVQWGQWKAFGPDPFGYHVTNLMLHVISSLLVWRLFFKLKLPLAWLGGLLFAIHPMQVESVAYINELKNTLSLPPFLLCLCAWVDFEETRAPRVYSVALAWFLLAMLCKISMAPFPAVILLYAWWKRGQITLADAKVALPFLLISVVLAYLTIISGVIFAQAHHAVPVDYPLGGVLSRVALVVSSMSFYLASAFLPFEPSPMYPQWAIDPPSVCLYLQGLLLLGGLVYLWHRRESWGRHALLGLGFFFLFLSPFLGLNRASYMVTVWVMDHFLYLPLIGLIGLVVAALGRLWPSAGGLGRRTTAVALALFALLLVWQARSYASQFRSQEALCRYTVLVNPGAWLAWFDLGVEDSNLGRWTEAKEEFTRSLAIHPHYSKTYANLAKADAQLGLSDEAQRQATQALLIDPGDAEPLLNLGLVALQKGQAEAAGTFLRQALAINPRLIMARSSLGIALCQTGHLEDGLNELQVAAQGAPNDFDAHYNYAIGLHNLGHDESAVGEFQTCVRLKPQESSVRLALAVVFLHLKRNTEAAEQFEFVLKQDPANAVAQKYLAQMRSSASPL